MATSRHLWNQIRSGAMGVRLAVAGMLISVGTFALFPCICGYLDHIALPGSTAGAVLAWGAFFICRDRTLWRRAVIASACVLCALILAKNIGDVLYWGHDPVLS